MASDNDLLGLTSVVPPSDHGVQELDPLEANEVLSSSDESRDGSGRPWAHCYRIEAISASTSSVKLTDLLNRKTPPASPPLCPDTNSEALVLVHHDQPATVAVEVPPLARSSDNELPLPDDLIVEGAGSEGRHQRRSGRLSRCRVIAVEDVPKGYPDGRVSPILVDPYTRRRAVPITRSRLGGLVWLILEHLDSCHTISLTDEGFERLMNTSSELEKHVEVVPLVLVTTAVLASTPKLLGHLQRWIEKDPNLDPCWDVVTHNHLGSTRPWVGYHYWSFDCWAVARAVVEAFLLLPPDVPETVFLGRLCADEYLFGVQVWKVPIIVATLYVLRSNSRFWSMLL